MKPLHVLIAIPLLLAAAPAVDPPQRSIRQEIRVAEDAASRQKWAEAADALARAQQQSEMPNPVLSYDQAVAAYRAGDLEQAAAAFEQAMNSNDPSLAGAAAYNLGNTAYQLASQASGGSPDGGQPALQDAADRFRQALQHYRSALANNPGDQEARANGELAWRRLQEVEKQQQEQQQQQDQQQQQSDEQQQSGEQQQQDQQQESGEQQQEDQQQQSGEQEQQQDQQQQSGEQQQEQQQSGEQQQQDQQEQSGEQQQDQQQSGEQQQDQQEQSGEQQQQDQQQQSGEQQQQDQQQQSGEQQQQDQQQQSGEQQQQDQQQQQQTDAAGTPRKPGKMTKQEAERLLQAVRDRERQRRLAKQQREGSGVAPTGKDW